LKGHKAQIRKREIDKLALEEYKAQHSGAEPMQICDQDDEKQAEEDMAHPAQILANAQGSILLPQGVTEKKYRDLEKEIEDGLIAKEIVEQYYNCYITALNPDPYFVKYKKTSNPSLC